MVEPSISYHQKGCKRVTERFNSNKVNSGQRGNDGRILTLLSIVTPGRVVLFVFFLFFVLNFVKLDELD